MTSTPSKATVDGYCTDGMSMRDYFAAAALPALIEMVASKQFPSKSGQPWTENMVSQQAFAFADAMLKARQQNGGEHDR